MVGIRSLRFLIFIHRWLSVPFSLLFAMWFASGIVMHFVAFPSLTEAERFAGLSIIDVSKLGHSPAEAVTASTLQDVLRVRLWQRDDGPVYLVSAASGAKALHAADLRAADIASDKAALAIASAHARLRGLNPAAASFVELVEHDQWTVANGLDRHRPLYRIALNDHAGTELYVSSRTGEVIRDTTCRERVWSYVGSVVHWIYPTVLRKNWMAWDVTVWWLSLVAIIAALSGLIVGLFRLRRAGDRIVSPYRRWHAWHHWLGLACATFLMTWIVSGWLSMDHGRIFSTGALASSEAERMAGMPAWGELRSTVPESVSATTREIEWFAFGGRIFQRHRTGLDAQQLSIVVPGPAAPSSSFLRADQVNAVISRAVGGCSTTRVVEPDDAYFLASEVTPAPVYRTICGDVWYQIDGANGANLEKLDAQRRAYRWLYRALHTFDFPALLARPGLRTAVIVFLCGFGVAFSITGIVIAWRRLKLAFR